jgi:hypothetical protein
MPARKLLDSLFCVIKVGHIQLFEAGNVPSIVLTFGERAEYWCIEPQCQGSRSIVGWCGTSHEIDPWILFWMPVLIHKKGGCTAP